MILGKGELEDGEGIWEGDVHTCSTKMISPQLSSFPGIAINGIPGIPMNEEFILHRGMPGWVFLVIQMTEILGAAFSLNPGRDRKEKEGRKKLNPPSSCVGCSLRSRKNIRGLKEKCHRSKGAPGEERGREMLLLPSALSTELELLLLQIQADPGPAWSSELLRELSLGAAIPWDVSCHEFRGC